MMETVLATGILLPFFVVLVVFGTIFASVLVIGWVLVRLATGGGRRNPAAEETKLIQELFHSLRDMERRVESLETLLLDQERRGGR